MGDWQETTPLPPPIRLYLLLITSLPSHPEWQTGPETITLQITSHIPLLSPWRTGRWRGKDAVLLRITIDPFPPLNKRDDRCL
ncbi:hypothetical protein TNCT_548091 [Trichonephila clavata]|uniref:Uncharacterized protein n=1 Tax=Trichonephila clavata TaxID=2740835 RepID=A0A8X6KW13_TRICU|nr:hypothetical protein TNCT_548091 [Trichonephila clavata]